MDTSPDNSKGGTPQTPHWWARFVLVGVLAFLLLGPVFALGFVCRPFWRVFLRGLIAYYKRSRNPKSAKTAALFPVWLLFSQRAGWAEAVPWLQQAETRRDQVFCTQAFAVMYLHNGRLSEAIQAAQFWASVCAAWIQEHPEAARESLQLYKQQTTWYHRPQQRPRDLPNSEEQLNLFRRIAALDGVFVEFYRDARVALSLLRWRQEHAATAPALNSTWREQHPFMPVGADFNFALATRLGVSADEFDRICLQAETLPL